MVAQHYRWDFIGLSTDTKPTPETSEKVVNGSTFYCSDNSKLYVFCDGTWYERKALGGGGGGGGSYTAGTGIDITDDTISVDTETIQTKLTAGNNITISDSTISATDTTYTAGSNITISDNVISATDTTYSAFTGTDGTAAGTVGLVPAPATTDAGKFLKADGTWDTAGGGSGPTVVQTTGTSTTDVMSQNAVTRMIHRTTGSNVSGGIRIISPQDTDSYLTNPGGYGVIIGAGAKAYNANYDVVIGGGAKAGDNNGVPGYSISLGAYANATQRGQFDVSTGAQTTAGYNNSNYRLLTGLYDPQSAHDAATKGYVDDKVLSNAGAPTTSTVGTIGQLYEDTTNGKLYICTAIVPGTDPDPDTYTWEEVGAGGGDTVYSTVTTSNSSTGGAVYIGDKDSSQAVISDPSSTDNHYKYFWALPASVNGNSYGKPASNSVNILGSSTGAGTVSIGVDAGMNSYGAAYAVRIGPVANAGSYGVGIGYNSGSNQDNNNCVSIGAYSFIDTIGVHYAVGIGSYSHPTRTGEVHVGLKDTSPYGFNNTIYRVIGGVHDGQELHDAATVAQGNKLMTAAPTTSDVGVLGELWTDTTNMHTYQCTAISGSTYTWTQRW